MLSLLFRSGFLFVTHMIAGLAYATPALVTLFAAVWLLQTKAHIAAQCALFFLFVILNTLYVYAAVWEMRREGRLDYFNAMRWRKHHSDFLFFIFMFQGASVLIMLYFVDALSTLYAYGEALREKDGPHIAAHQKANITVVLFGSRALAAAMLLLVLFLWCRLCRGGIGIPAHVAGHFLRASEAAELMRGKTIKTAALSLLFIAAVAAGAQSLFLKVMQPAKNPHEYALIIAVVYFFVIQFHLSMWVELYRENTKNRGGIYRQIF